MIEIRGIENTHLDECSLLRVVRRYWRGERLPLIITFRDKGSEGIHQFDGDQHWIRFNYLRLAYARTEASWNHRTGRASYVLKPLSKRDTAIHTVAVLLHELRHAQQAEKDPRSYIASEYRWPSSTPWMHEYNEFELDAEIYAKKHIHSAWRLYSGEIE